MMNGINLSQSGSARPGFTHWVWYFAAAVALIVGAIYAYEAFFQAASLHQQHPLVPVGLFAAYGAAFLLYEACLVGMVMDRDWGGYGAIAIGLLMTLSGVALHYPSSPLELAFLPMLYVLQARRAREMAEKR
jgi:hypothetical protein